MASPAIQYLSRGSLRVVTFPASAIGLRTVTVGPEANTVRGPKTTREFLAMAVGVLAITNGPMFDYCRTERTRTYAGYTCATSKTALHDPARGITLPGRTPEDGITLWVMPDGSSGASAGARWPPEARVAIQCYPSLVRAGRVTQGLTNLEPNTRSAIARLSDGRMAFIVGVGLSNPAFAAALGALDLGGGVRITDAGYTDGSGSSALWAKGPGNAPLVSFNTGGRRLVAWVTVEDRESVPARLAEMVGGLSVATKVIAGAVFLAGTGYLLAPR